MPTAAPLSGTHPQLKGHAPHKSHTLCGSLSYLNTPNQAIMSLKPCAFLKLQGEIFAPELPKSLADISVINEAQHNFPSFPHMHCS